MTEDSNFKKEEILLKKVEIQLQKQKQDQDFEIKKAELRLKEDSLNKEYSNLLKRISPALATIIVALVTFLGSILGNLFEASWNTSLNREKLESSLITKCLDTEDNEKKLTCLQFLSNSGIVKAERFSSYVKEFTPDGRQSDELPTFNNFKSKEVISNFFYNVVDNNQVFLEVLVGEAQAAFVSIFLDDKLITEVRTKVTDLPIGLGKEIRGKTLRISSSVIDINSVTNKTALIYRLKGGESDRSIVSKAIVSEDNGIVLYFDTITFE